MSYSIRVISFQEVKDYLSGEEWSQAHVIPITPERAGSQGRNPHAGQEDP